MLYKYIKSKRLPIILFITFSLIFGVLSFLYGLPFDGVLYAFLLCLLIFLAVGGIGFAKFRTKVTMLDEISKNITSSERLPETKDFIEQEYQNIIVLLQNELAQTITNNRLSYSEIKDFYALWVHQIKTPIAALNLLLQNKHSDSNKELRMELFKIERYTDLVLNYLRLEDISADLSFESCTLCGIVNQAVRKFAPVFIAKDIKISLEPLEFKVLTDEKWLVFALEQIISNSVKYTPVGGQINIFSENDSVLVIKDNGFGIAAEDLPRIFEKGFTGYNGRMDKKATGLGLYLTKRTLEKLGHSIDISSSGNDGTTVKIDLSRSNMTFE